MLFEECDDPLYENGKVEIQNLPVQQSIKIRQNFRKHWMRLLQHVQPNVSILPYYK
jgi:hypothetical protein